MRLEECEVMRLASIIDVSLVDVPKIPVTVIFLAGCNFDCPYCQNAEIIPANTGTEASPSDIAHQASGFLTDGFCITGGEPTIQHDLPRLLALLKKQPGKHINLNTQGSVPDVLKASLTFLDSVWFDMKTSPAKYPSVARTRHDPWPKVEKSIRLLLDSDVSFWPRTTFVGGLIALEDIMSIMDFLSSVGFQGEYLIQNFIKSAGTREEEVEGFHSGSIEEVVVLSGSTPPGIRLRLEWR
jgi:pyruvate formate lyase activating enzyme